MMHVIVTCLWTSFSDQELQSARKQNKVDYGCDVYFDSVLQVCQLHKIQLESITVTALGTRGIALSPPTPPSTTVETTALVMISYP